MSNPAQTVWYAVPSIRPQEEAMRVLGEWQSRGYKVAVQRDPDAGTLPVDLCVNRPYSGYAEAVNHLVLGILTEDPRANWIVIGGDDMLPDPKADPQRVVMQCEEHFHGTFGIMQPTGDRHLVDKQGKCAAERVCVSPWLGREWCHWSYEGKGPLCAEYFHCFVDEELHEIASSAGLLWHRPDLTQYHAWWARERVAMPPHVARVKQQWDEAERLFRTRKAAGFPGSGFLPNA